MTCFTTNIDNNRRPPQAQQIPINITKHGAQQPTPLSKIYNPLTRAYCALSCSHLGGVSRKASCLIGQLENCTGDKK